MSNGSAKAGVYFISGADRSTVKIGKSKNIAQRFGDLARMNAGQLTLLAAVRGYTNTESHFHRLWKHLRLHGEWFRFDEPIASFVSQAANNPDITLRICPAAVRTDDGILESSQRRKHSSEPEAVDVSPPLPEPKFSSESAILAAWRDADGWEPSSIVDLEWSSLPVFIRQQVGYAEGVWLDRGHISTSTYAGLTPVASQLVQIADPDERTLAAIYAAVRNQEHCGDSRLHGRCYDCTFGVLARRIDIDNRARHWLPIDHRWGKDCPCLEWRGSAATSPKEWVARLAHLSELADASLARIVNGPRYET